MRDKRVQPDTELSDSDDEGAARRRHRKNRKLTHPVFPPARGEGSEAPTLARDLADATDNGEGIHRDEAAVAPAEPVSPTSATLGLSMNAFGRPKMTAAAVGAGDDMEIDDPILPANGSNGGVA